ncbi:MAG: GIY-YIG nuclease family protein [Lachnospiraceae bacterium]|nr:GIY-YIG nuclease family protein [Lachnospiraceae bacterium]
MLGHIYKVTNKINNKVYIGQTIQSVKDRWYRHCGKSGISEAEMNTHFKRAILKYGKENFILETIETCDVALLDEKEQYYIKLYDSYNNGYNFTLGGQGWRKPFKTSEQENKVIIELYKMGFTLKDIGKEFSIDKATVKGILVRYNITLRTTHTCKFSQFDRQNITTDYNEGMSRKDIMKKYSISKGYLSQLITGKRRI